MNNVTMNDQGWYKRSGFITVMLCLFTLLNGCATVKTANAISTVDKTPPPSDKAAKVAKTETIYSAEIRQHTLWFMVKSTGCTSEKNFELFVEDSPQGSANSVLTATLVRKKADRCKAMPSYVAIEMSHPLLRELNEQGDPPRTVQITNPLAPKIKPVHKRKAALKAK